jgi:hypothetical protein
MLWFAGKAGLSDYNNKLITFAYNKIKRQGITPCRFFAPFP